MTVPSIDPKSLTVEERLELIDVLWNSIQQSAAEGDAQAASALERWTAIDSDLLEELAREADEAEKDPASQTAWEDLLVELKRKYG